MATAKARSPDVNPRAPAVECKKKKKNPLGDSGLLEHGRGRE